MLDVICCYVVGGLLLTAKSILLVLQLTKVAKKVVKDCQKPDKCNMMCSVGTWVRNFLP